MQRTMTIIALCLLSASSTFAATCQDTANEKKLAGAALKSFMEKCEKDATATCDASAREKKLAGAAKTSFTKKCVFDSVGK